MLGSFLLLVVESRWISGKKFLMHRLGYVRIATDIESSLWITLNLFRVAGNMT
jgi:hypothetical protein